MSLMQDEPIARSAKALVVALLLAGCSDYEDSSAGGGGSSGQTVTGGTSSSGGQAMTGGTGGSGAQVMTGGAGGSGAQAMTGGTSGSGGASGSGTGGVQGGSGGGGQAACAAVTPCGGDVVGTWSVASSCTLTVSGMANMMGFGLGCASAPVTGSLTVTGTWTAMPGGTYMDDTTTSGEEELELPPGCLTVSGTTTTCDALSSPLRAMGYAAVTCIDNLATSGCTCSATVQQMGGLGVVSVDAAPSGVFTAMDNKLVTTAFGTDTEYSYCLSGSTLTMTPQGMLKAGTVTGPIVLQKQ
jgi:hypothetical protein